METLVYYIFSAMLLGGALGVLLLKGYVNTAMSMLVSMLGAAGMMVLMHCFFLAFVMVTIYAGAVLVLFVFIVMLVGDIQDNSSMLKRLTVVGAWICLGAFIAWLSPILSEAASAGKPVEIVNLSSAKNYGLVLLQNFMLPLQIAGALLLAAMVGVMVLAKTPSRKKAKRELL